MATTPHSTLTGSDLHEPKGAASASANTLYVADGSGSGSWLKITSANLDLTSLFNVNVFHVSVPFLDIGTAGSIWVPVPHAAILNSVVCILQGAAATTDTILTVANTALSTIGTITVAFSGSAGGDVDTLTASVNNTFSANTFVRITSDGGASNAVRAELVLTFTRTA